MVIYIKASVALYWFHGCNINVLCITCMRLWYGIMKMPPHQTHTPPLPRPPQPRYDATTCDNTICWMTDTGLHCLFAHACMSQYLRSMCNPPCFLTNFAKGNNFFHTLSAPPGQQSPSIMVSTLKGKNFALLGAKFFPLKADPITKKFTPMGAKFFPLRVNPRYEGRQN